MSRTLRFALLFACLWAGVDSAYAGSKIQITAVAVNDLGLGAANPPIPLVDTYQDECGTIDEPSPEPFYDAIANITVVNTTRETVRFKDFSYRFAQGGTQYSSPILAPGNSFEVPAGGRATVVASLFMGIDDRRKFFAGDATPVAIYAGPISVTFTLKGKRGKKKRVTVSATSTVSFSNYNRCPNS
ncbi:MAG: hypothetical protein J0M12_08600 [Deltaproteobacteria bacterium]|nr:hypothetical protein [Deltaproteobacteria bacterium]